MSNSLFGRKILIFSTLLFIFGIFPLSVIFYSHYRDYTTGREIFITRQSEALNHYAEMIKLELNDIFSDLEYIYKSPALNDYLNNRITKTEVEKNWLVYSRAKGSYDQIRYIDADGMEEIRIDYNDGSPSIVSSDNLQNKRERDYFSMLTDLEVSAIVLSRFDLNIENGEIEKPYKPMLRISLPLYTDQGDFNGAIILNYLGSIIMNQLKQCFTDNDYKVFLLNQQGYILLGPVEEEQWGFMLKDGTDRTFEKLYESDWSRIENSTEDAFQSEVGIYIRKDINIKSLIQENNQRDAFSDYRLHSIDETFKIIIMGEKCSNPLLCQRILKNLLSSKWKMMIFHLLLSAVISYCITTVYVRKLMAEKLRDEYKSVMKEVVRALELTTSLEDDDTGNHIKRVCHYSRVLANGLGLPKTQVELISDLASLHDIGKVGIHDSILKKRGILTDEEREEMKKHVDIGYETVSQMGMDSTACNIIRYHHENWDSSGYNSGLKEEEIPIEARIVAIADVYDALRSRRSYKPAFSHEKAKNIISNNSGLKFDPKLVAVFLEQEHEFHSISIEYAEDQDSIDPLLVTPY